MPTVVYIESSMSDKREATASLKANVRISIRDGFSRFCRENGEIQADTLGKLIEWFMELNETTRITVMAKLKGGERLAVAKLALEMIIKAEDEDERSPPKPDRRARA